MPLFLYTPPVLARVQSYLLSGIDALPCEVEVDFDNTSTDTRELIVGLPDAGVKEALQRVRAALANTGYTTGNGRLLVNLAPADLRKEGPVYDLPIALGLLISAGARPSPCPGPFRSAARSRQGSLDAEPFGRPIASLTLLLGRLCDRDPDAARFLAALGRWLRAVAGEAGRAGDPRNASPPRRPRPRPIREWLLFLTWATGARH